MAVVSTTTSGRLCVGCRWRWVMVEGGRWSAASACGGLVNDGWAMASSVVLDAVGRRREVVMVMCGGRVSTVNGVGEQAVTVDDGWRRALLLVVTASTS
ncbi:hypothetical protein Dimus_018395, partial [Dionaea muscipula]